MARRCIGGLAVLVAAWVGAVGLVAPDAAAGVRSLPPETRARLLEKSLPVLDDGSRQLQRARLDGAKAPDGLDAILVMCDFADSLMLGRYGQVEGDFPPPMQRERYYAAHDSLYFDHQLQYVADYFATVSAGRFDFQWTIHPRVINLPYPMSYYGDWQPGIGERKIEMAAAVIDSLDEEIEFLAYDTILLVHAGAGEETDILGDSPEQIYSSFLSPEDFEEAVELGLLAEPFIPCRGFPEGTGIDQVLILPETEYQDPYGETWDGHFGSLGVYCFEIGLRLGMLSLSDLTPAGRPDSQGIGQYGLMGYGLYTGIGMIPPHPCAFNKSLMGWVDVVDLDPMTFGTHVLEPAAGPDDPGSVYRVSLTGQEYWLVEYRLQDGDGNRAFTFPDDKNRNSVYDYWDASTADHRPVRGGDFDAAADSLERPLGAEWDFSMSENNARVKGELGFGSGAYIWHVDEGRIRDVFDAPTNLFNGDPDHKAVDLEEADGIQDLDSAVPGSFWLGSDRDSFRGEGNDAFGPETLPSTVTATGARTGIAFTDFSDVFQKLRSDTVGVDYDVDPPVVYYGIQYADTLAFTLSHETALEGQPEVAVRREFPAGTDLRGSHVLIADLDAAAGDCGNDGPAEIVLAGGGGEIFVLNEELDEVPDQDGNPQAIAPIAVGTRGGEPAAWNLPAAVGDLDGDGAPEIVLTSADGLYAFEADGTALREAEAGSFGLYADLGDCALPPVLLPLDGTGDFCLTEAVAAWVVVHDGAYSGLRGLSGPDAEMIYSRDLGLGRVVSPPVLHGGRLLIALADTAAGTAELLALRLTIGIPEDPAELRFPLQLIPGRFPVAVAPVGEEGFAVHVIGAAGGVETLVFADGFGPAPTTYLWSDDGVPLSPLGPGQSFLADGRLGRTGYYGSWLDGWPRRPAPGFDVASDLTVAAPLVVGIVDVDLPLWQYLFTARDGRIFGTGTLGEPVPFWPLAGPAESAGTPAAGAVGEIGALDLVAIGTFARISGWDEESDSLDGEDVSTIFLWKDLFSGDALWPMWGGSPWRNGSYDLDAFSSPPYAAGGTGLVPGSHSCYPSPLLEGPLFVRGALRQAGRVRAFVYNLEGEEVTRTDWIPVGAPDPFTIEVPVEGAVTGIYLSRIEVETQAGSRESSVRQFAIVH